MKKNRTQKNMKGLHKKIYRERKIFRERKKNEGEKKKEGWIRIEHEYET